MILRRAVLLFFLSAGLRPTLHAQPHYMVQHFTTDNGLPSNGVKGLEWDEGTGFLWIATENGLFRYDGSEFHRFGSQDGIEETLIFSLFQDALGRIWITTNDHIYVYSGTRFEVVNTGTTPIHFGLGQRFTTIDPQHILFLNHGSLMLVQQTGPQQQWTAVPFFNPLQTGAHPELAHLHSVFADSDGMLWLGCGNAICRVKDTQVEVMGEPQGS